MTESIHVYAGECTTTFRADDEPQRQRGRVVVVHKPDGTVLVHDARGYQPVAWLTRANAVHRERGPDGGFALVAVKDGERLRVESHGEGDHARHEGTSAGVHVGFCPDCTGCLVRARGAITCLDCPAEYGLPRDAAMLETTCDCGLPRMAVERGARFELCVDRNCEELDAAVRERFDREWSCPDCGSDLRVLRERTLFLGCDDYPDCEASFALPDRAVVGTCDCGLPLVAPDAEASASGATSSGSEMEPPEHSDGCCLDADCARTPETV
ncbi:topoisomerase DNA-binding C4 zinc finger domain-containing protein [Halorussus litoreus]|uniref:topoisomerase DNA-binding C4 zinc finger domain-containing protein n=1 Tax=Halorussus litoreus TaxID=1710536 RepID=UPI000E225E65|nr:topoisomerase DNA-binding C4 zinc finger domain-containing protein [Halorussus litoreus]